MLRFIFLHCCRRFVLIFLFCFTMWMLSLSQEFVRHCSITDDLGSQISKRFPVSEVHKLAIFDIRILNGDRHCGNIFYDFHYHASFKPFSFAAPPAPQQSEQQLVSAVSEPMAKLTRPMRDSSGSNSNLSCLTRTSSVPLTEQGTTIHLVPFDHGAAFPAELELSV